MRSQRVLLLLPILVCCCAGSGSNADTAKLSLTKNDSPYEAGVWKGAVFVTASVDAGGRVVDAAVSDQFGLVLTSAAYEMVAIDAVRRTLFSMVRREDDDTTTVRLNALVKLASIGNDTTPESDTADHLALSDDRWPPARSVESPVRHLVQAVVRNIATQRGLFIPEIVRVRDTLLPGWRAFSPSTDSANIPPFVPDQEPPRYDPEELTRHIVYPDEAIVLRIEGTVRVNALIDAHGNVVAAVVVKHVDPLLDIAALDAVMKCPFLPATIEGKPSDGSLLLTIGFEHIIEE